MKLRTRLILSYLVLVCLLTAGLLLLVEYSVERMTQGDLAAADHGVDQVARANLELSEEVLGRYGEEFVRQQGKCVARRLENLLRGRNLKDYAALRADKALRAAATPDMLTYDGIRAGYCDMLDDRGVSVLHPNKDVEGKNFREWKSEHPRMWEMVEKATTAHDGGIVAGYYTFIDQQNRTRKKYMSIHPVEGTPFFVCAVVNIDDYFWPVHGKIRAASKSADQSARAEIFAATVSSKWRLRSFLLGGAALLVFASGLFGWYLAHAISQPILELRDGVRKIGEGDFAVTVREGGIPEVAQLAHSVNRLGGQLTEYMDSLTREVKARQAVESELTVASQIQKSLLPHSFPPFPDHQEFSLYAINQAAKQVGGDFYDFFFIGPGQLTILIGDVSGKGVPASLFMAVTRTVMRIVCAHQENVALALTQANRILCRDKDNDMFVTLFLACYDLKTGRLDFANAGHNPPYLLSPDGDLQPLSKTGGMILAVEPKEIYLKDSLAIEPGQTLVLYTDGVTEAMRPDGELFGEERFEALLRNLAKTPVTDLCQRVAETATAFQEGDQHDDITVLAWRRER